MVKKYLRPKVPPEFMDWLELRRANIERIAKNMGCKKGISRMKAMRLISLSKGGVELTDEMLRKLKRRIIN